MFKFELKQFIESVKESYLFKGATLRDFAPLIGIIAVCIAISISLSSDELFLRMVGYTAF